MKTNLILSIIILLNVQLMAQDYFLENHGPYDSSIPSPEKFLGYAIGDHHTRQDRIVDYFEELASKSDRASLHYYGRTYGHRDLVILTVTQPDHLANIENIKSTHLKLIDPQSTQVDVENLPIFVQLGYNVHGNEPSGAEAALLTAYTLVASENPEILNYLDKAIFFIDPVINPDGRDRHSHWANMHKGDPVVSDPNDIEHNEGWPRGRTNHYWFDLNRDWWLAIHPESRGKLNWYHEWYPNVVTDFHEMGTNSTHFFEPMKTNGSKDPIMPKENFTTLNENFAKYFSEGLDEIGSLYFTKEVFDGTYPGYGSSYPDLQGGLGLLFEQASSRGHAQKTDMGELTFAFTIRNQYVSSLATIKASVENKDLLHQYQKDFFKSAITGARKSNIKAYVFGSSDINRNKAFIDKLLLHKVKVYPLVENLNTGGRNFIKESSFIVPTEQSQFRIVQSVFETYDEYHDSVFYDASAWSLVNFYNMNYEQVSKLPDLGDPIVNTAALDDSYQVNRTEYAYLLDANDYNIPAFIQHCQLNKIRLTTLFKPISINTNQGKKNFDYGTLMIPVAKQDITSEEVHNILVEGAQSLNLKIYSVNSGYSLSGVDLGSRYAQPVHQPKVLLLVGDGTSGYEAGEVWHLLDQRVHIPITKITQLQFRGIDLSKYNTMVLVSGSYNHLDSAQQKKIKSWVAAGNTLITSRTGSLWVIKQKIVKESLVIFKTKKDSSDAKTKRKQYVNASEEIGRERVGGTIFQVDLDLTHPLAFGYDQKQLPVYRNSEVWISPSENPYANVALYSKDPHIDGFITDRNLDNYLTKSASLIVSKVGRGRVILFADNPNFRGAWYGTNRLFLNAIFLGNHIQVPTVPD